MLEAIRQCLLSLFLLSFALGCGVGEIGEPCNSLGSGEDCVDNAICVEDPGMVGAGAKCRRICTEQSECGQNEACTPVTNTDVETKACQPG